MKNISSFVTALDDLAVVDISGADAAHFLNSQLTQDVAGLATGRACLAGYCTAKGRLLASMVAWPEPQSDTPRLRALVKADLAQALVKRLTMFVLRAKAKLEVEATPVIGVTVGSRTDAGFGNGDTPDALWQAAQRLDPDARAYDTMFNELGTWIAAPCASAGLKRWWFVPASSSAHHQASSAHQGDWQAADIAAGLPWVEAATQDVFIPQTLNFDLIDGVSFTKGCYPGQEVVARSHYRGTIKRRMARGTIALAAGDARAEAGADIFDAGAPDNPCGRIINAARCSDETLEHVLMEVQLSDLESADFRLERPDGMPIQLRSLPYEIKPA